MSTSSLSYLMVHLVRDVLRDVPGDQKCPLIFFIFRYIKHYTYINLYIYIKKCADKFFVGLKIWTSWGSR